MIGRQRRDHEGGRFVCRQALEHERLGAALDREIELFGRNGNRRATRGGAAEIGEAASRDRKDPRAERVFTTREAPQAFRDREPHLALDVFGGARLTCAQVSREARLHLAIQGRDGAFVAGLGGRQQTVELLPEALAPPHQREFDHFFEFL